MHLALPRILGTALAGLAALVLGTRPGFAHEPEGPEAVHWKVESTHSSDDTLYLRVGLHIRSGPPPDRPPLNLALVLDRSGSMDEDAKIGYVRQAVHLVVDNLTPADSVAFVAYADRVETLVPMQRAVNRDYLHHRVEELHAEGYTNLSAGLLEGCAELGKRRGEPGRHRLILLTDGLANRGVTDREKLAKLVERCSESQSTLTAIGLGNDYDERLLAGLASAGGGRYLHVSQPDQLPAVFKAELGALLAVALQNGRLRIEVPPGLSVDQVFGSEEPPGAGPVEVFLGDLADGDEIVLLARVRVAAEAGKGAPLELRAALTYDDVAQGRRIETDRHVVVVRPGGTESQDSALMAHARLAEALDKIALAVASMDRRLAGEVERIRQQEYPALKRAAVASDDQDFVNKAFLFEHFARELDELLADGALHDHSEERARLQKEIRYRQYLRGHHRPPH